MAKVQISVRIDADLLARVEAFAADAGITRAGAVERLVVAGLDADQHRDEHRDGSGDAEVLAALRQNNTDLRMTVSTLTAQLAAMNRALDQEQKLHAMSTTKALAPAEAERVTLGERWRRWWSGRS